ncbi:MAG: aminopeptidase P family protein [Pseudomonadota bacterium]
MFQTFEDPPKPPVGEDRLARLRAALNVANVDGFLIPRADAHQGEYVAPCDERLAWLTGFTGSAGLAVVLGDKAAILVDGRYTLQVRSQVDAAQFEPAHLIELGLAGWLKANLEPGQRLGFDPWLHTLADVRKLKKLVEEKDASLVALEENPIDQIWADRPDPPSASMIVHNDERAGASVAEKSRILNAKLGDQNADAAILTDPDSICWAFNIRGQDVAHNPVVLGFAILHRDAQAQLFTDPAKLTNEVGDHLGEHVTVHPPTDLTAALGQLAETEARIMFDPNRGAYAIADILTQGEKKLVETRDPVVLPKAIKNAAEIEGARQAHRRDAIPFVRFLTWLDQQAEQGGVDEISAARRLEALRAETGVLRDISFDTISGSGPNGAIIHYRVTKSTNRPLEPGSLYLVDSGAQYADGTTDITRTIAIGDPPKDAVRDYTLVLKGHIAIALARFPVGTTGTQIDTLARYPLWQAGLDYDHGTGHGVGSFLSVHEGPQNISKRGVVKLEPGMILSNEPGYYRTDQYGIRIENLVLVTEAEAPPRAERDLLCFETLTLAPYEPKLIDPSLLTADERDWLNAYNARIREELMVDLDDAAREFLERVTQPV